MAQNNSTSSNDVRRFDKELSEDVNDYHLPENSWTQARNAINNSKTGDLGKLGNEPANQYCAEAPYVIIGAIHTEADVWAIFSTDETSSEIGLFKETGCIYTTIVNDKCLNFSKFHLVKGVSRPTSDCNWKVYWDDANNPSRVITLKVDDFNVNLYSNTHSPIPWIQDCLDVNGNGPLTPGYPVGCITCTNTPHIDCEKIRLASLTQIPCITLQKGASGGTLLNGSYFATLAYTLNGEKATDYFKPSNIQPLFDHTNIAGSLDIFIEDADTQFDGFELVIVYNTNNQNVAKRLGVYNITQKRITIDSIDLTLITVPIELIPLRTTVYEKTEAMYSVSDYLIRVAPTTKFDFNYQPLANQIITKWQAVEYPADYYKKGGSNTGYMRDEVYTFFIRWIYDTGDRSSSYHIPGRPALTVGGYNENAFITTVSDALPEELAAGINYNWAVNNLAQGNTIGTPISIPGEPYNGLVTAEGIMGYWESSEYYPNNNPEVWNANELLHPWTAPTTLPYNGTVLGSTNTSTGIVVQGDYDLCGKPIRHHRFPDNFITPGADHYANSGTSIRIMGVKFDNVLAPVDNEGNLIPGIVGYEILRGSRQANKSVIFKGIINNMRGYDPNLDMENPPNANTGIVKGLFQNYPYNDLRKDPFLSTTQTRQGSANSYDGQTKYSQQDFTFHSPDTTFAKPFLAAKELKVYGEYVANVEGRYRWSELHPRSKVLRNLAFLVSSIAGVGIAAIAMNGRRTITRQKSRLNYTPWALAAGNGGTGLLGVPGIDPLALSNALAALTGNTAAELQLQSGASLLTSTFLGGQTNEQVAYALYDAMANLGLSLPNISGGTKNIAYESTNYSDLPDLMKTPLNSIFTFFHYLTQGIDTTLELIRAMVNYGNFALKYNSHGFYSQFRTPHPSGNRRRSITDQSYLGPEILDYTNHNRINNLFRNKTVAISVNSPLADPYYLDNTRQIATDVPSFVSGFDVKDPTLNPDFITQSSCHYSAMKQRVRNQYGQIDSISQILVNQCYTRVKMGKKIPNSGVLFGGDIYIGRYTEKTTFFFFYDWLYNQPDGAEFNYDLHKMIPFPRFWLNTERFDTNDFTSTVLSDPIHPSNWIVPSSFYNLDNHQFSIWRMSEKYSYFYLFNSGIRDFFVESEINVDFRDFGNFDSEKHYPLLDKDILFDTSIIKAGNYYKYDTSLSIFNTIVDRISWGNVQPRSYSPYLSETCYTYTPTRAIYSLQSQYESKTDFWRLFLANNYFDFDYYVTCIKPVNKNGAMIFFDTASPVQFQGTDQLQTDLGTKLTIGDGGLFSQPMQSIVNADTSYEYGSCQDSLSVINTPMGIYWMSENQGKVFKVSNGIEEISLDNMKWWFAQYLPYELLNYFPDFQLTNNPVAGIGCQTMFDNQNQLLYFCKKDYTLRDDIPVNYTITYITDDQFAVNVTLENGTTQQIDTVTLGNALYFKDASWTISYDPKSQGFISYHDWHPNLSLPGKNTFMTVNPVGGNSIWVHNQRCDLYCNYYGADYPWEIEWMVNTANQVNTLRSIEYQLEVYKYAANCYDRFHELDTNFDEAVVYNTEQCSGLLKLNISPKNNAPLILNYPIIGANSIDILYSKVEQKYRFNQFWDITNDRGEYPIGSNYPPPTPNPGSYATQTIWNTQPNGYIKLLNANNLNYNKFALQRKKFRHYSNTVLLRKLISGNQKFLVMLSTNKNLYSPR